MPADIKCGQQIKIYGRDCDVYDCDAWTKNWYQ